MKKLKVLDLFSGIGGFSLGLERTGGFETVAFCEIEEFPRKVLKKHWPDVPIHEDIRKLDGTELRGTVDVITGGYPCQPFSQSGQRAGEKDDRHLWPEMYRIIKAVRPRWVIAENVAGHITMGLDRVLSDLEAEDYTYWPFVIPACAVDAKHRRDRVWVVANTGSKREPQQERLERESGRRSIDSSENVADCKSDSSNGVREAWAASQRQPVRRCGGESNTWTTEPDVGRVANGIPARVDRLKGLGNAVVPQIPEMIGYAILEHQL